MHLARNPGHITLTHPTPTRTIVHTKITLNTQPFPFREKGTVVDISELATIGTTDKKPLRFANLQPRKSMKARLSIVTKISGKPGDNVPRRYALEGQLNRLNFVQVAINIVKIIARSISTTQGHKAMENFGSSLRIKPNSAINATNMVGVAHHFQSSNVGFRRTEELGITSTQSEFNYSANM